MKEVIVSKISTYDHDEELWFTKIGYAEKDMPLLAITAGKTITESRERAEKLAELFSK